MTKRYQKMKYIKVASRLFTPSDYDTREDEVKNTQTYEVFPITSMVKAYTECIADDTVWVLCIVMQDEAVGRLREFYYLPTVEEYKKTIEHRYLFSKEYVIFELESLLKHLNTESETLKGLEVE